jgi:hypothetical protein
MSIDVIRKALMLRFESIPGIIPATSITSIAPGTVAVFNTSPVPHGLVDGLYVVMSGMDGTVPLVDDNYIVKVIDAYNFSLQDTATTNPIGVTIAGSAGTVTANLTSWPNAMFQSVVGVPYAKIDWVDAAPSEPTQGGGFRVELGYMQATLVYPPGIGTGAVTARAELIRSYFAKGTTLVQDGLRITIPQTPQYGSDVQEQDTYQKVIRIYHSTQIFT